MMKKLLLSAVLMIAIGASAQKLVLDGFYSSFNNYNYDDCQLFLEQNQHQAEDIDRLLWYLNNGIVNTYVGNYEKSNEYFAKAKSYFDELNAKTGKDAAAYMLNPIKRDYRGEDSEQLMIYYFMAFNYLHLNDANAAINELSNIESVLQRLDAEDTKGKKDISNLAITYLLKGISYETLGDIAKAFDNYRRAYDIYEMNYGGVVEIPAQLKRDIVRTASLSSSSELANYETKFGITYADVEKDGSIVAFWHNGLAPVKRQLMLNYRMSSSGGGMKFVDATTGESFPLAAGAVAGASSLMTGGGVVKMAYPKFNERPEVFVMAQITAGENNYSFEKCEDVSGLAIKSLKARKKKEMGEIVTRYAVKQLAKAGAKKLLSKGLDQAGLGALSGIANKAVDKAGNKNEKADLRHWSTLPHSVYYTRVSLPEGSHTLAFQAMNENGQSKKLSKQVNVSSSGLSFVSFATHEAQGEVDNTPVLANTNYSAAPLLAVGGSTAAVSGNLSEPLPLLKQREYAKHLKKKEKFYTQVVGESNKELKHGFRMRNKEHLTTYYGIVENSIGSVEDKVYLEVKYNTKVRKKIMAIQNIKAHVEEVIWADLKSTIYPNLTKNASEAKYKLVIDINKLEARNNHFIMYTYLIIPAYIGFPTGLPKFKIEYQANLYSGNNLVGNTASEYKKQSVMFGLYRFSKQIGRPRYKNRPDKVNPMEQGLRDEMGKLKTELYQMHLSSAAK